MQLLHHDLGEAVGDAAFCGGGDGVVAMVDFHRHHGSRGGVPNHGDVSVQLRHHQLGITW